MIRNYLGELQTEGQSSSCAQPPEPHFVVSLASLARQRETRDETRPEYASGRELKHAQHVVKSIRIWIFRPQLLAPWCPRSLSVLI
jgi:hypothetical protein